jgi:hypothetical protein
MTHLVYLEEVEGRWVAFVPELIGCFASADVQQSSLDALPAELRAYAQWRREHGDTAFVPDPSPTFEISEIVREWPDPAHPDYVVSAFFAADAPPLTGAEISQVLPLAEWAYADLLQAAAVPDADLRQPVAGEWSIAGILNHCSRAAWWYLTRLDYAPPADKEPRIWSERLAMAHLQMLTVLPSLAGAARIELRDCELWSPLKMVRRWLWHLRDHTQHIYQFRTRLGV